MRESFPGKTLSVYLVPPSASILRDRLLGRGDGDLRTAAAIAEMDRMQQILADERFDAVLTADGNVEEICRVINVLSTAQLLKSEVN